MMHGQSMGGRRAYCALHGTLVSYARKWVDSDTAEDLAQEAFVRAIEGGRRRVEDLPVSYFKIIVKNLAMDLYAKRSRDRALSSRVGEDGERLMGVGPETALLEEDLRERLAELSQRQWESLVMTVVLGMTEHEAASAADVSRSAVTGGRDRALEWLRRALPGRAGGSTDRLAG